ncbi:MAG: hypothetical protein VX223_01975 [Myxococcota bacterium]|nr:hypothetical protein [Myxococcota bacterium]
MLVSAACSSDGTAVSPTVEVPDRSEATNIGSQQSSLVDCSNTDEGFIRQTLIVLYGRHAHSKAEVQMLVTAVKASSRADVLRQLMRSPEYLEHWSQTLQDFMSFNRFGERVNDACATSTLSSIDTRLAAHVRDNQPLGQAYESPWTTVDLYGSALLLDDLSPLYLTTPFATLGSRVIDADDDNDERAFRRLYGSLFQQNYLGRRMDCLRCHNSEFSVTPDTTYPLPGLVEAAVFGESAGRASLDLQGVFRVHGVLALEFRPDNPGLDKWEYAPGVSPWGMAPDCGQFKAPEQIEPDPLGYEAFLVESLGPTASIWDLEEKLRTGFETLRGQDVPVDGDGHVSGDVALAWMASTELANKVWTHVSGHPLVAPHNFPRNIAQRDLLLELTQAFTRNGFSLQSLLIAVLTQATLNTRPIGECDSEMAYTLPALFNPWTEDKETVEEQPNGLSDIVIRHPPSVLLRAAASAMQWSHPNILSLYEKLEAEGLVDEAGEEPVLVAELARLETDLGIFVSDAEIGFRGSSFRESLAWEHALGSCRAPWQVRADGDHPDDFIDMITSERPDATFYELTLELKDRLLASTNTSTEELQLIERLAGLPLDSVVPEKDANRALRRLCIAWLSSPDFQLGGMPVQESTASNSEVYVSTTQGVCDAYAAFWDGPVPGCN